MSQDFMDPEIFADFILEAREHLETIEPALLELEKTPENVDLLNVIFRPMHSLKGASGFLGLNLMNGLAHKAENILDELRNGKMLMSSEIMDTILAATDALTTMINNLERIGAEGEVETREIIGRIEAALAGKSIAPAPGKVASPLVNAAPRPSQVQPVAKPAPEPLPAEAPAFDTAQYALTVIGEGHLADFMEEAREIVENLNQSLIGLEKGDTSGEILNDLFRFFHNLKGNSGIIAFRELNAVTHEAETLLNRVRKGEMEPTRPMIDLLLGVADFIEALLGNVDVKTGSVTPLDTRDIVNRLRMACEGDYGVADGPNETPEVVAGAGADTPETGTRATPAAATLDVDPEDAKIFISTVQQQLTNVSIALAALESDSSQKDFVDGLYRSLTTIKNSAGYMGFEELKVYADRTSGLVDQGRKTDMDFGLMLPILEQEASILRDMAEKAIADLSGSSQDTAEESAPAAAVVEEQLLPEPTPVQAREPEQEPESAGVSPSAGETTRKTPVVDVAGAPAAANTAQKPKVSSTIRVDHEKLDHLMNLIGELIINRNRFSMLARDLEEGQVDVQEIAQSLVETTDAMNRISDDLQDTIMNVRMVPVASVFSRFPRLVRDLARKSEKSVELITEGEETELDKSVVEVIGDPLVHLIRNSVDHGLEPEEDRIAAGKPSVGKVTLRAYHKGNSVAIEIEDDGRGIDPEKMRQVAIRKGIISPEEARALDDREAMDLIFAPGFSSAETITDISGRGVGMDVVRTNIKNLKGSVSVHSVVGKGTKFTLSLPLTLAIIDALMVKIGKATYAIPLDAVSETTKIEARRLSEVNGRKAVTLRGSVLGIVELRELLDQQRLDDDREILPIVVIHDNDRRLGIIVDSLLERQEIVIKPLGHYLSSFDLKGVSGATIMGDGSVVLILDPHEMYGLAAATRGM